MDEGVIEIPARALEQALLQCKEFSNRGETNRSFKFAVPQLQGNGIDYTYQDVTFIQTVDGWVMRFYYE